MRDLRVSICAERCPPRHRVHTISLMRTLIVVIINYRTILQTQSTCHIRNNPTIPELAENPSSNLRRWELGRCDSCGLAGRSPLGGGGGGWRGEQCSCCQCLHYVATPAGAQQAGRLKRRTQRGNHRNTPGRRSGRCCGKRSVVESPSRTTIGTKCMDNLNALAMTTKSALRSSLRSS